MSHRDLDEMRRLWRVMDCGGWSPPSSISVSSGRSCAWMQCDEASTFSVVRA